MEKLTADQFIDELIERAKLVLGQEAFCEKYGITISWFSKFVNGHIVNPGFYSVRHLSDALDAEQIPRPERRNARDRRNIRDRRDRRGRRVADKGCDAAPLASSDR